MAENKNYDVVILGGGPGGYVAAIRAGQLGLKTAVIEKEAVGGVCLHHGCIPSKTIIRSAEVLSLIQRSETFGIKVDNVRPDFGFAIDRSQKVIQRLYNGVQHLMKNKVDIHLGTGRLVAPNRIEVTHSTGKTTLQGERVLIATGSRVRSLPNIRIDGKGIFTSDEALLLRDLPRSIAIIGGGAVGVEFAYVYAIYGVDVTIIEMTPALLPTEDHEVSALLERSFKKRGVSVLTGVRVASVKDQNGGYAIQLQPASQAGLNDAGGEVMAEAILVAIGRAPNVEGIGLEPLGIALDEVTKAIRVDERMQTNVANVYAIGDVTTRPALAHGAMAQGVSVVESIAGLDRPPIDLLSIPNAVYCQPQVASVGLTEAKAKEAGHAVKVVKFPFSANGKALALGETDGFVKIVSNERHGEILGAHLIGPEATELIGEFIVAKTLESTALELKQAVHPHPTLSEAVMEAGGAIFGEAIHM